MTTTGTKPRRGRRVLLVIVVALLAGIGFFEYRSRACYRRFDAWQTFHPCDAPIDLSQPGTHSLPFEQTCGMAHSEIIEVQTDPASHATLTGLRGTLSIVDERGVTVCETAIPQEHYGQPEPGHLLLAEVIPFRTGRFTLKLDAASGAPSLRAVPHRLVARYELCGLEAMPGAIYRGLAIVSGCLGGFLGMILGIIVLAPALEPPSTLPQ